MSSTDELNGAAERFCAAFNASMVPHKDTRLRRGGKKIAARLALWNSIDAGLLRELPDAETCRLVFTAGRQVRTVGGGLAVSAVHPNARASMRHSLSALPGISVGQTVNVQPILVDDGAVALVTYKGGDGALLSFEVKPIEYDEAGFDVSAPVIGREYRRPAETAAEKNAKELAHLAADGSGADAGAVERSGFVAAEGAAVPFAKATGGAGFKTHSPIRAFSPFAEQTVGGRVEVAAGTVEAHEMLITAVEAAKRFKARTGRLPDGLIAGLRKEHPDGVPASLVDDLVAEHEGEANGAKFA